MSRIASRPIPLPDKVEFSLDGRQMTVKGPKGELSLQLAESVSVREEDRVVYFNAPPQASALAGTMNSLLVNNIKGVQDGYSKKLELIGVGYRAQMRGKALNLNLGFSHPIDYTAPEGVTLETPSQTEVVVSGIDKQQVGQVAAEIRSYRPPEPYKGKGVRYSDERVLRKEAKKK
ncbi:MAG: 50S ribosomal protein L6 [Gammaproteobacteria bacterium]|nr:50S ribosomal protein L6 [Gammaproteobacteria bacterium]